MNYNATSYRSEKLVLLHGFGFDSKIMQPLAEKLRVKYQVTLIDLPGYGKNKHLVAPDNLNDLATMIIPQIPAHAIVIGWSLGGLIALKLMQSLSRIKKIILLASSPCFIGKDNWPGVSNKIFDLFSHQMEKDINAGMEIFLYLNVQGLVNEKNDLTILKQQWMQQSTPEKITLLNGLKILKDADLRDIAKNAHYILSEKDQLINHAIIEHINPLSASILTGQGHAMLFLDSALVASHVVRIINAA